MENRSENSKAYAQAGKSALWVWSDGDATRPPRTRREIALSENSKQKSSQKSQSFVGLLLSLEFIPSKLADWQPSKLANWQLATGRLQADCLDMTGNADLEWNFKLFVTLLPRMAADIHFIV